MKSRLPSGATIKDDADEELINKLIDDLRGHKMTRFGGGSCVVDFKLTRVDAVKRVEEFLREAI